MGTASKSRGLWEEPSICERHREISICLALNHDAAIDAVVTDLEAVHPYIEVDAGLREIEQRGVTFGVVDAEHVPSRRCICRVRGLFRPDCGRHSGLQRSCVDDSGGGSQRSTVR